MKAPILRIARMSDDFKAVLQFYRDGLGLTLLFEFKDHNGFDGVVLGRHDAPYHLEFTKKHNQHARLPPSDDNLLVFYLPDPAVWLTAVQRMRDAGFAPVLSFNPYWEWEGVTFEDPDGYRIVLHNATCDV